MADLNTEPGPARKRDKRRAKKLSTRVDLTPMVDLGFLLITFFFVTTVWAKPHVMKVNAPADGDGTQVGMNAALTVLAGSDNKIFYYQGRWEDALKNGNYGITGYALNGGIGGIIRQKQQAMDSSYKGGRKEMMLLIKGSSKASFKNIVDLLDEMPINGVLKYALVDITAAEKKLLAGEKM
jgi:biopolymer transport protein ExbD